MLKACYYVYEKVEDSYAIIVNENGIETLIGHIADRFIAENFISEMFNAANNNKKVKDNFVEYCKDTFKNTCNYINLIRELENMKFGIKLF